MISSKEASRVVVEHHYLHRRPPISFAYGLFDDDGKLQGVVTFGIPASRHLQKSLCPSDPSKVIELSRLWVDDAMPRNSESWFLSRALGAMPPRLVVSYADTAQCHFGYVYRASNFFYAGWSDMDRKTPRFDYVTPGKHTRQAFRGGSPQFTARIRRLPKVKYWTVTGGRAERRELVKLSAWPRLSWRELPPPGEGKIFA